MALNVAPNLCCLVEEISLASKARGEISFIQHNVGKRQEVQQTLLEIGFRRKIDIILV